MAKTRVRSAVSCVMHRAAPSGTCCSGSGRQRVKKQKPKEPKELKELKEATEATEATARKEAIQIWEERERERVRERVPSLMEIWKGGMQAVQGDTVSGKSVYSRPRWPRAAPEGALCIRPAAYRLGKTTVWWTKWCGE